MNSKPTFKGLLRRTLSPAAFAFLRLRRREAVFCLETVRSWFTTRAPEVRGFGAGGGAPDLVATIKSVNVLNRTKMCRVMLRHGSDKSYAPHNYTTVYSALFKRLPNQPMRVFELGLGTNNPEAVSTMGIHGVPGASLRGWREIFPDARVYGADIDRDILFEEDRIKTFYCNQLSQPAIAALWSTPDLEQGANIIIEDGLHTFEGNTSFLEGSLEHLNPGGIYVVEDISRDDAEQWFNILEKVYTKRYPTHEFAFVSLPNTWGVPDNNMLVVRRRAA